MKKISLLLIFITLIISQQIQYDIGSKIQLQCQKAQKILSFKLLREFGLAIIHSTGTGYINIYNNNSACAMTQTNTICIFNNMTKQVRVACGQDQNITLQVFKPQILTTDTTIYAKFIEVHFAQNSHGIINLDLDSKLTYDLRSLSADYRLNQFFVFTECFLMADYFEDKLRLAIQKSYGGCIIGLKQHESWWTYSEGENHLIIDRKSHKGYIHKMRERRYTFEKRSNLSLQISVQSEIVQLLNEITFQVKFMLQNTQVQQFKLQNFQKGIFPLGFSIFFNKTFDSIRLTSNKDVFYIIYLDHNFMLPAIEVNADEYIYTHLKGLFEFMISLDNINEQQFNKKKLYLLSQPHESLNISYYQCTDPTCSIENQYTALSYNYFTPNCKVLVLDQCKIKVRIVGQSSQQYIGLLPYIPENVITLELNKIHNGVLKQKRILHYLIPKQILEIQTKNEITIQSMGAKVFATYYDKCNRINCCQFRVIGNELTLPKKNETLKIFVQGTKQNHYSLLVNTNRQKQYIINQNQFFYSFLKRRQERKYYIFEIKNQSKKIQIILNSLRGSLAVLVNIEKQDFANDASGQYYSSSGYLSINQEKLKNKKIFITILRLEGQQKIDYSLLIIDDKSIISLPWQKIFYTRISQNNPKIFSLKFQKQDMIAEQIGLKIDLQQMKQDEFLTISFGNPIEYTNHTKISRLSTLKWTYQILSTICSYTKENICQINIKVTSNINRLTQIEVLFWKTSEPFRLIENKFTTFESGGLGQINQLYYDFSNDEKPITIYIYSNQVLTKSALKLFFHNKQQKIFHDLFPRLTDDLQTDSKSKVKASIFNTASISYNYRKQQLAFPNGKQSGSVLITIRDLISDISKSHRNSLQPFVNGTIKIGISRGIIEVHDDDKFEYLLQLSETQTFIYDLVAFLKSTSAKEQLYFFTTNIIGKAVISYQVRGEGAVLYKAGNISQVVIINLNSIIDKSQFQNSTDLHIKFIVKNVDESITGRYLSSITSTNLNFRQLSLGVPTEFYIPKHTGMTFLYIDLYPEDFKIKTNRKQGFPQYKIRSCKPEQDRMLCLKSLQMKQTQIMNDTSTIQGRSHELEIHKKSEHYCKGCRYLIAFYAKQSDISGSIIITKKQSYVLLQEGKIFTSMIYSDQTDYYLIVPPVNVPIEISIIPHMSQISAIIQIYQYINKQQNKTNITELQNAFSISLTINGSNNLRQINIKVRSKDKQNALYTIVFTARSNMIELKDGVPLSFLMPKNSISHFQYKCEADSNLLILSDTELEISILCENQELQVLKKGHMLNYKNTIKTIQYPLYRRTCQKFEIILESQTESKYQIFVNGLDIMMLPFDTLVSTKISQKKQKTYQIAIQQKTYLKFVLRFCGYGIANLMIAEDKASLDKQQYSAAFDTSGNKGFFVFDYTAPPGLLYFRIGSQLQELEYSIEVFPYHSHNELKYLNTDLADPLIRYHEGEGVNTFNILFNEITVNSKENYKIQYFAVISNNKENLLKYINCITGVSYDQYSIIRQQKILPQNQINKQIMFQFKLTLEHAFLTIVPRFQPMLPAYTQIQKYQIIELYKGTRINLIKKFFNFSIIFLAQMTGVKDQIALNILFVLTIMFLNMLIICLSCCVYARYYRLPQIIDRVALPSSQTASRNMKIQNSLDMLERVENQSQQKILV